MDRVIEIFRDLCAIPHGSGNMEKIAAYCVDFAKKNGLFVFCDEAKNVIIKKEASPGYEKAPAVMLQGHMDMVCQKDLDVEIDFETQGITPVIEGNFMTARGTTLGADNGIAVAMILALLERHDLSHPALEAVLTTDEEIGLLGAGALDVSRLSARSLINLDSEEEDAVTVSCAGGSKFSMGLPVSFQDLSGDLVQLRLSGLQGGHSGTDIHKGRVNAICLMGRVLCALAADFPLSLTSLSGGEKKNAIPSSCCAGFLVPDADLFFRKAEEVLAAVKSDVTQREKDFTYKMDPVEKGALRKAVTPAETGKICDLLFFAPSGVQAMSQTIPDLVETSLNLGIVRMEEELRLHFSLRSNREESLLALEERMKAFARLCGASYQASGRYSPWEYNPVSPLRDLYLRLYREEKGKEIRVAALHAGVECGVISARLPGLDCISIGPDLFHVHTPKEKMDLSSAERVYHRLQKLLEELR